MAVDDVYLLTMSATQFGTLRQNTLAFINTTSTEPIAGDFGTIATAYKNAFLLTQSSSLTWTSWRARQIAGAGVTWPSTGTECTPTGGKFFEGLFTGGVQGGEVSSEVLPPQCAMVVTLRSGLVGRSHRGRLYLFGWAENQQNGGTWNAGIIGTLDTNFLAFLAPYTVAAPASGHRIGIWSTRIASGCRVLPDGSHERTDPANPDAAFTPLISHLFRTTVYTQRRRVTGIGL